jgi:hypothetical protein
MRLIEISIGHPVDFLSPYRNQVKPSSIIIGQFAKKLERLLMNDELSGQLTSTWKIPDYAREALWIESDSSESAQTEGEFGLFTLSAPASVINVRWGAEDGCILARLKWQADTLEWDGSARIGGYIDAIHLTEIPGSPVAIAVLFMGGQPLKPAFAPYPNAQQRLMIPPHNTDFHAGLAAEAPESLTTWLVPEDSPLMTFTQDAMLQNTRLYCFGRLAEKESGWDRHFALPLLLESVTLFAP